MNLSTAPSDPPIIISGGGAHGDPHGGSMKSSQSDPPIVISGG